MTTIQRVKVRHCLDSPDFDEYASDPRTVDLLCSLVAFTDPQVIVEAGTYLGHTSLALAHVIKECGLRGHVWTADVYDPCANGIETQGVEALGVQEYITVYHGSFDDMLATITEPVDFAYLDASAKDDPGMRERHLMRVTERASPGALIVVDDVNGNWPGAGDMREGAGLFLVLHRGLAIFQKRRD